MQRGLQKTQKSSKHEAIRVSSLGRIRNTEYVRWFQLVSIEEGSHLIGQLGQDALGKGHAVSLQ